MTAPAPLVPAVPPWGLGPFVRQDRVNPILAPRADTIFRCPLRGDVAWEAKDVFNPAAVVRDGKVWLVYRAEDTVGRFAGTSRLGLAWSSDGLRFTRLAQPVLFPDADAHQVHEWEGGCEDPRLVEREDGTYVLTYTAFDGACARLFVATSRDLLTWTKHGSAFAAAGGGAWLDTWSKSGAIVCARSGDRLVAARIDGRYWMYFGESDIFAATSADLIAWAPVEAVDRGPTGARREDGGRDGRPRALRPVFSARRRRFDSHLVEPGPPALLTEHGILFIYNSANSGAHGDPRLPAHAYCAGQALLDARDPLAVIGRSTVPFFMPERGHELSGQVGNVTFLEGLVHFRGAWFLYFGTADSTIAVAVCGTPAEPPGP